MVQAHSAHALVAGCPAKFTLLQSTPYADNNFFLYGQSAVVTDAYKSGTKRGTKASRAFSFLWPGAWYAWNQTYIPYNLEGLDGKSIIKEVLQAVPAEPNFVRQDETERHYRRRVWKILVDMHGDQKWYSLRFGCWLLNLIFKWLFNGELFVNLEVCSKLRDLAPKSTFVYVPTHKSHLDYHMLSYVLFSEGLACPHIAAGDNLNLPIIGGIMRTCGAFFIRRSIKSCPDAALYKSCLDRYLRALMAHGAPTEFFIEGGRARDGRIAPPKHGLLTSAVHAALTPGGSREGSLYIVPVAISYDFPLEEAGLLRELLGDAKLKETIWQFISAFTKLVFRVSWAVVFGSAQRPLGCGGVRGRTAVGFGQPICVQKFLTDRARRRRKRIGARSVSKPNLLHVSSSEVTFEELLDLARAEDAALKPQAQGATDSSITGAAGNHSSGGSDGIAALVEALPPGSDSRRAAVSALGNEIHTRLLRSNTVPSSAVLAAALLPASVVGESEEHSADPYIIASAQSQNRFTQQACSVSSCVLERRYRWVQRQLTAHGVPVMPLPAAPLDIPFCAHAPAFLHDISVACAPHVTLTKHKPSKQAAAASVAESTFSTPQPPKQRRTPSPRRSPRHSSRGPADGGKRSAAAPFSVQLREGAEPTLWQHTRLNMMLPATAPVGLVAAALCMANGGSLPCAAESNGFGAGIVDSACVVSTALWLRGFLAPDLNAALGMEALTSAQAVQAELASLVNNGAVFRCSPPTSNSSSPMLGARADLQRSLEVTSVPSPNAASEVFADTNPGTATGGNVANGDLQVSSHMHVSSHSVNTTNSSSHSVANGISDSSALPAPLCYCVSESGRKTLAFHAATLVPLIATYAAVLKYACAELAAGEVMSRSQFVAEALKWLREAAARSTSAMGAVCSQVLVQHALEALVKEGCLSSLDEEQSRVEKQERAAEGSVAEGVSSSIPQAVFAGLNPITTRAHAPPPGATSAGACTNGGASASPAVSGSTPQPPLLKGRGAKVAEAKGGIAAAKGGSVALHAPAAARRLLSALEHSLGALDPLLVALPQA